MSDTQVTQAEASAFVARARGWRVEKYNGLITGTVRWRVYQPNNYYTDTPDESDIADLLPDLFAATPAGAAWRESCIEWLTRKGCEFRVHNGFRSQYSVVQWEVPGGPVDDIATTHLHEGLAWAIYHATAALCAEEDVAGEGGA